MWACYFGEISESYRERWEPHKVTPDQREPDVFDVLENRYEIGYRLDSQAAAECFSDGIKVDWGGWAYKVAPEQIRKYNRATTPQYRIPEGLADYMDPEKQYAIIDVEVY